MALSLLVIAVPAYAGPPFVTDDPETVDYRHVEIDAFTEGTQSNNALTGTAAGLDANYGLYPNVQLSLITPLVFNAVDEKTPAYGYGDTQFAVKYRFVNEDEDNGGWQVAIYPQVNIPTGNANRSLGTGQVAEFLPVYVEKDFDPWQIYGGSGYWNNPGIGNRNYWFFGGVVQRKITDYLTLGGEFFHQTANTIVGRDSSGMNIGGTYDFNENYHLLFSTGSGILDSADNNVYSYYLAFQMTY
ncbi:MAG: transporter [Alphaproteobacteria bacterium]|nr:transporter [Alphaproteobacteria bacterium]